MGVKNVAQSKKVCYIVTNCATKIWGNENDRFESKIVGIAR